MSKYKVVHVSDKLRTTLYKRISDRRSMIVARHVCWDGHMCMRKCSVCMYLPY